MPDRLPISATIICQNEEACIGACLASLSFCAEIIVVDSGSTDRTLGIIRDYAERGWPIRLIEQKWLGYAKQKQFALDQATQEWVLSIDADEWPDAELRADMPRLLQAPPEVAGWRLRRTITLFTRPGRVVRAPKAEKILRLARRGRVRFDDDLLVHEGLVADGEQRLAGRGYLLHERNLRSDFLIVKQMDYTRLKVKQRLALGKKPRLLKLIFNPMMYFIRYYFQYGMVTCGIPGFIHAGVAAVYSFQTEALHYQMWQEQQGAAERTASAKI